jgi:hypothetical protein
MSQQKLPSIQTRSSLNLLGRYDRLSTSQENVANPEERTAMSSFSRATSVDNDVPDMPKTPSSALKRESQITMSTLDSEPPRFRSVPSWVNHQEERQMAATWKQIQRDRILEEMPIVPVAGVKRKPVCESGPSWPL